MPPSRIYTNQQKRDRIARKNYLCGHYDNRSTDAHPDIDYQHNHNNSHLVLSKYFSQPSWVSDGYYSSDSESSANISTIHVAHANLPSYLSQLTENSCSQLFDLHQRRRMYLREQSIANKFEEEYDNNEDGFELEQADYRLPHYNQDVNANGGNQQQEEDYGDIEDEVELEEEQEQENCN